MRRRRRRDPRLDGKTARLQFEMDPVRPDPDRPVERARQDLQRLLVDAQLEALDGEEPAGFSFLAGGDAAGEGSDVEGLADDHDSVSVRRRRPLPVTSSRSPGLPSSILLVAPSRLLVSVSWPPSTLAAGAVSAGA